MVVEFRCTKYLPVVTVNFYKMFFSYPKMPRRSIYFTSQKKKILAHLLRQMMKVGSVPLETILSFGEGLDPYRARHSTMGHPKWLGPIGWMLEDGHDSYDQLLFLPWIHGFSGKWGPGRCVKQSPNGLFSTEPWLWEEGQITQGTGFHNPNVLGCTRIFVDTLWWFLVEQKKW